MRLIQDFVAADSALAARALEELAPDVAGALIDTVADPVSVTVLAAMLPHHAARCIATLPPEGAVRYLSKLTSRQASLILRNLPSPTRTALLAGMPTAQAMRIRLTLNHAATAVGAWMYPVTLSLPIDCDLAEAKRRLKAEENYPFNQIYVVDKSGKLLGMVMVAQLFSQADDSVSIRDILRSNERPVHSGLSLAQAMSGTDWNRADFLPVTDREGTFIGILRYADLRAAMARVSSSGEVDGPDRKVLGITENIYLSLADLLSVCLSAERNRREPQVRE